MTEVRSATSPTVRRGTGFHSLLHVNEKGGRFGGTEEYVALVTPELARRGVRSHLACGVLGEGVPEELASVEVLPALGRREGAAGTGRDVAEVAARLGNDVVYLHNVFDAEVVTALDRLRPRPTLLWYVHDHYPTCLTELRLRRGRACAQLLGPACLASLSSEECTRRHAWRPLGPRQLAAREALLTAAGRVDAVVVVSRYMQDVLCAHLGGDGERVHLLPRPFRLVPPHRTTAPHETGGSSPRAVGDRPRIVVFAGRITPEKGLDVVIEALGALPRSGPVELRIAGVVEHHEHWGRCVELARAAEAANPALRVRYLGHLPYEAADALMAEADVVVVPSRWPEPLGAVVGEALAAGAAVVASRAGGLDTFVEDGVTGLLVEPGDVEGWREAMQRLLDDPDLARQLAERGAEVVAAHTAAAHVDALDDLVRRLGRG